MRKKKLILKVIVWIIIISFLAVFVVEIALANQAIPSTPPQNVVISNIAYQDQGWQNWFARFSWNAPVFPPEATGERSQTFYFNKVERGTGRLREDVVEINLGSTQTSMATSGSDGYGIDLDHGTIYEFYGRSNYTYGDLNQFGFQSGRSNRVRFLTNVEFGAEMIAGTNEIKIVWDDVWDTNGRIDYRLLISDTSGFTQPPSIPDIIGATIGTADSRVVVSGSRLEYVYTNALPGREYSIKLIPLVKSDVSMIPSADLPVVQVKTEILLRAKKMGETSDGVRWMLFWDPIIKGAIGSSNFTRVEYKLYRYDQAGKETFFALVTDKDRFEMNLKHEDVERFKYKIEAVAYRNDGTMIPFYSNTLVSLIEQIPEFPAAPEFVNSFPTANPAPVLFDNLLTGNSATLLWTAPLTGEGLVDTGIYYDLYLFENLEDLKSLPISRKIASNMTVSPANEVKEKDTGRLLGYRHTLHNMRPNSIYYAVMVAKKNFLIDSGDGFMITRPYISIPSVKVIITRPDMETDKPLAPPSPPFRIKPGESIGKTEVTLQMEKSWTELYHQGMKKWLYVVRPDDPERNEDGGFYNGNNSFTHPQYLENRELPDGDENKKPERTVNYTAGWQVNIHCVKYEDAVRTVRSLKNRDFVAYSDLSQSYILSLRTAVNPVPVPNLQPNQPQAFSLPVKGLEPNTTYLMWVTVKNSSGTLESEPSDPLLVTTLPQLPPLIEVPVVPTDLKGIPADTYIDLFWGYRTGYSYNIAYATEDDRSKAVGTVKVSAAQLRYEPWYRVGQLKADTLYYFWIQAISPPEAGGVMSDWSNSLIVKTEPYQPPPKPRGFGIKSTPDAISETSIFYEWLADGTVTYILEVSERADFSDSTEYSVNGSEFQVTGLKSNYRYFARLFAYSAATSLRSEPSPVIMVVTRKGRGEYDADVPLDAIPVGDMLVIDPLSVNGVWTARAAGINAHRLSERIRQLGKGTFTVDLTKPPPETRVIRLELDGEVLETLSGIKENLLIRTLGFDLFILPGSLLQDDYFRLKRRLGHITVRVDIRTPAHELHPENFRQFIAPVTEMKVYAGVEDVFMPLGSFLRPVMATVPVGNINDRERIQMRFHNAASGKWEDIENTFLVAQERIVVYPQKSGAVAATVPKVTLQQDLAGSGIETAVQNILKQYSMPSLPSRNLEPGKQLTVGEGMKHLLDIVPFTYQERNLIESAVRAGLLQPQNSKTADAPLRRDEAIYAAMMVYTRKTGQDVSAPIQNLERFSDWTQVQESYRSSVAFAVATGIVRGEQGMLAPQRTITRQELLLIIERILMMTGEI